MSAAYTKVDLHQVAKDADCDLEWALHALKMLYADVDHRNSANTEDLDLPCKQGCDACCRESVFLTPLEFFAVWEWAQRNLDDATCAAIIDEGLRLYTVNRVLIDELDKPPPQGEADHLSIAQQIRFTCPFLDKEGGCRVYPVRELYARMFGCSFNEEGGIYACDLVGEHLGGKEVSLLRVRSTAVRLNELPLTGKRQVYPYYLHLLYGDA